MAKLLLMFGFCATMVVMWRHREYKDEFYTTELSHKVVSLMKQPGWKLDGDICRNASIGMSVVASPTRFWNFEQGTLYAVTVTVDGQAEINLVDGRAADSRAILKEYKRLVRELQQDAINKLHGEPE